MSTTTDLAKIGLSNASLTETELRAIRQLKLDSQKDIERLTGDIAKLLNQQLDLLATVKLYDVALAPHKKLPLEVLRAIMIFAASEPTCIPVIDEGVYAMSHVCSPWRQLMLDTPELWSNISIDVSKSSDKKTADKIRIAREWLSRAQNHPISFTIKSVDQQVLNDLITHYPCRALYLLESRSSWYGEYPRLGEASIATLETLHLHEAIKLSQILGKEFALPALKSLSLYDVNDLNVIHTVAPQLHYLRIQCTRPHSQVLGLLRLCVQLEHCELKIGRDTKKPSQSSTNQAVVISTLRVLKLTFDDGANAPAFLKWLALRNVSSLSLFQTKPETWSLDLPTVSELIARSDGMPHLQSLTIDETKDPFDLKVLLLDTPSLRQLHINRGVLDADTMDKLSTGHLGAQLKELYSRHRHEAEAILRMVESRHQTATTGQVAPFSSVRINGVAASTSASVAIRTAF
ncbi:hypothetical protein F5887DRAFT_927810 [Amanita rubescens]|nr:hypothetical protein F5887DRAFT_927810 [Amanita rubescens]